MPSITIRNIPEKQIKALKEFAKLKKIPRGSVEELLRREIVKLTESGTQNLPLILYMTPALPLHFIAEKEDGSRWLILSTAFGPQAWSNATEYKGNYTLERLPDYMAKLFLPDV